MEQHTPAVENGPIEGAKNVQETQQPLPEVNNSSHLEDDRLIAKARAVGVDIENTSWKVLAYGIYARVVDVSEIERVSAANE